MKNKKQKNKKENVYALLGRLEAAIELRNFKRSKELLEEIVEILERKEVIESLLF